MIKRGDTPRAPRAWASPPLPLLIQRSRPLVFSAHGLRPATPAHSAKQAPRVLRAWASPPLPLLIGRRRPARALRAWASPPLSLLVRRRRPPRAPGARASPPLSLLIQRGRSFAPSAHGLRPRCPCTFREEGQPRALRARASARSRREVFGMTLVRPTLWRAAAPVRSRRGRLRGGRRECRRRSPGRGRA